MLQVDMIKTKLLITSHSCPWNDETRGWKNRQLKKLRNYPEGGVILDHILCQDLPVLTWEECINLWWCVQKLLLLWGAVGIFHKVYKISPYLQKHKQIERGLKSLPTCWNDSIILLFRNCIVSRFSLSSRFLGNSAFYDNTQVQVMK